MLGLIEIAPRRCSPGPGMHARFGGSLSARFTLPDEPRNLKRVTASTSSVGSARGSTSSRKVRRGSSPDTTTLAGISSPSSSATPTARPFFTITCVTVAFVRISAPAARAAEAIDSLTAPVPPLANPHARNAPSISPM